MVDISKPIEPCLHLATIAIDPGFFLKGKAINSKTNRGVMVKKETVQYS